MKNNNSYWKAGYKVGRKEVIEKLKEIIKFEIKAVNDFIKKMGDAYDIKIKLLEEEDEK